MDYKNMALGLLVSGPRPGNMLGGYNSVPRTVESSFPKNEVDRYAIIQQIMQGMAQPKRRYGPALQHNILSLPDNAG